MFVLSRKPMDFETQFQQTINMRQRAAESLSGLCCFALFPIVAMGYFAAITCLRMSQVSARR